MIDEYGRPVQPRKKSPLVWIGIGCGILFIGFIGFIVFVIALAIGSLRSSDPYRQAIRRAEADPRVVAALGQPIKVGWLISGSINTQNRDGSVELTIPISGPRGKATIYVEGKKKRGRWTYTEMIVTPDKGEEIDLLEVEEGP